MSSRPLACMYSPLAPSSVRAFGLVAPVGTLKAVLRTVVLPATKP